MDDVSTLAIEGLFLEMLAAAARISANTERPRPGWLKQAKEMIDASFPSKLAILTIAESIGVHPIHLATVFRQHYSCTIGGYIRQRRIEYACRQLSLTEAPLVEIALASGFSDQSHFCKTFKQITGMSPTRFRART